MGQAGCNIIALTGMRLANTRSVLDREGTEGTLLIIYGNTYYIVHL